ncbi:aspartate aminotransferase family protein [Kitasatospora sp. NPDC058170]|uniref:aspartate aminotransferase family protein n=1 Tax=Kitasatospora sp. NPDC058170 TaxID=3346364 RepID=UPI0036D9E08C
MSTVSDAPAAFDAAAAAAAAQSVDAELTGERYERHFGPGKASLARMLGTVVETYSEGAWITAADGKRYLDFGGYGVFILGHRHPRVVEAVKAQIDRHPLATRVFLEPVTAAAAEALASVTPGDLDLVHFVNSGAEATEAGIKLARAHGKNALITTERGFHGKTMGALSVTANRQYQQPFEPLLPDTCQVPYGDAAAMREALAARAGRACVIVEPVQGEGGVRVPPPGYLKEVAEACREFEALLIVDEIQTGLGRLGTWWGCDAEEVVPDILLVGKGLSGGVVPAAAMVARPEVYLPFGRDPILHSSTFGASPIACAAALAAVETIRDEKIVQRSAELGERLLGEIRRLVAERAPWLITEVRGRGLLIAIQPAEQRFVGELLLEFMDRGVLLNHSLNASEVLRFTPPAILTEDEIQLFLTVLDESLTAVADRV